MNNSPSLLFIFTIGHSMVKISSTLSPSLILK